MSRFREFYEKNGVDYNTILQRMMGREELVEKYIKLFMADTTYIELEQAVVEQDLKAMEFKVHTLKGIAVNLNFENLGVLSANMMTSIRSGDIEGLMPQFEKIKEEYTRIINELGN